MYKVQNQSDKKMSQLPGWLWPNSNILPPLYKKIWEFVREEKSRPGVILDDILVDTNKIFPILLTSQLSTEILGYIWSIANKKYSGQLTQQELYIVLALVALAQASYPFNSLDVLHIVRVPPIPNLNLSLLDINNQVKHDTFDTNLPNSSITINNSSGNFNLNSNISRSGNHSYDTKISSSSNNCGFGVNFTVESRKNHLSDSNDDFSEFQSAPLPSIPQIPMWDSRQGSAIGSRLANHNLGVKKSMEKLKKNSTKSQINCQRNLSFVKEIQLDTNNHERNTNFLLNNELQLNDSVGNNSTNFYRDGNFDGLSELFPKCSVKSQSKTVILKDTIIRNEPTKSTEINSKNFNDEKILIQNKFESIEKNKVILKFNFLNVIVNFYFKIYFLFF